MTINEEWDAHNIQWSLIRHSSLETQRTGILNLDCVISTLNWAMCRTINPRQITSAIGLWHSVVQTSMDPLELDIHCAGSTKNYSGLTPHVATFGIN